MATAPELTPLQMPSRNEVEHVGRIPWPFKSQVKHPLDKKNRGKNGLLKSTVGDPLRIELRDVVKSVQKPGFFVYNGTPDVKEPYLAATEAMTRMLSKTNEPFHKGDVRLSGLRRVEKRKGFSPGKVKAAALSAVPGGAGGFIASNEALGPSPLLGAALIGVAAVAYTLRGPNLGPKYYKTTESYGKDNLDPAAKHAATTVNNLLVEVGLAAENPDWDTVKSNLESMIAAKPSSLEKMKLPVNPSLQEEAARQKELAIILERFKKDPNPNPYELMIHIVSEMMVTEYRREVEREMRAKKMKIDRKEKKVSFSGRMAIGSAALGLALVGGALAGDAMNGTECIDGKGVTTKTTAPPEATAAITPTDDEPGSGRGEFSFEGLDPSPVEPVPSFAPAPENKKVDEEKKDTPKNTC